MEPSSTNTPNASLFNNLLILLDLSLAVIFKKSVYPLEDIQRVIGGLSEGDPPLPIPNREVKPFSADVTAPERVGK